MSTDTDPTPRGTIALLGDRRFGPYVTGQWLSNTGNWFHNVAIGIVVFQVTGSNTLVGTLGGLQYLFTLLLAPLAGQLSDRLDRRRLLLGAQASGMAGAVGLAVVVAVVDPSPALVWPIAGFTCLIGIGYAIGLPTLQAYVPSLVPRRDLPQAIALNSVSFNLARAIGPALAGLLVAAAGAAVAFGVNAMSFVLFGGVLVWLGRGAAGVGEVGAGAVGEVGAGAVGEDGASDAPAGGGAAGEDSSVWAGLRLARTDPLVGTVMLATIGVGIAADPVITLAPAMAESVGGGAALVGGIGSAFGAGGTLASFGVSWLRERVGPRRQGVVGLVALGVGMALAGIAPVAWLMLLGVAVAGAGFLHAATTLNSTLQLHVEDDVRGRVMALWGMGFLGVRPAAAFVDGVVADLASVEVAVLVSLAVALLAAWRLQVADVGSAGDAAPASTDG